MPSRNSSPAEGRPRGEGRRRGGLSRLRLRLLSQLDQRYGREKAVLRKAIRSLEKRLRREAPGRS